MNKCEICLKSFTEKDYDKNNVCKYFFDYFMHTNCWKKRLKELGQKITLTKDQKDSIRNSIIKKIRDDNS